MDTATIEAPPIDRAEQLRAIRRKNALQNIAKAHAWQAENGKAIRQAIAALPSKGNKSTQKPAEEETPHPGMSDAEMLAIASEIAGGGPPQARLMALDRIAEWSGRRLVGQSAAYKPDPARLAELDRVAGAQLRDSLGERNVVIAVVSASGQQVIRGEARQVIRELAAALGAEDVLQKVIEKPNESACVSDDSQE